MQKLQETHVWSLHGEDPLEEGMATHSSIPAWRIPWTEEAGRLQSIGSQRVRHEWSNLTHAHTHTHIYIYTHTHTHLICIYVHLLYPFICQWTFNILKIFIYFIKLWGSWLWHAASSIFVASCGLFSCSMQDLVPWPRSELGFPCMGSVESSPLNFQASPNIKSLKDWK